MAQGQAKSGLEGVYTLRPKRSIDGGVHKDGLGSSSSACGGNAVDGMSSFTSGLRRQAAAVHRQSKGTPKREAERSGEMIHDHITNRFCVHPDA